MLSCQPPSWILHYARARAGGSAEVKQNALQLKEISSAGGLKDKTKQTGESMTASPTIYRVCHQTQPQLPRVHQAAKMSASPLVF